MDKLEKVIKGITQCMMSQDLVEYETQCADCPYFDPEVTVEECMEPLKKDVIDLLKEQQAIIDQYHQADTFLAVHGWQWKETTTESSTNPKDGEQE